MSRQPKLTKGQVKAAADRAEGIEGPDEIPETLDRALSPIEPFGRPVEYKEEFVQQVEKLCQLGATDIEIGDFFGVDSRTIYRWKIKYPDFCRAIVSSKAPADDRVERSLYHRATGYTYEAEKVFQYQGVIVRAKTIEHVPPDTTACVFWLKNRRKEVWRDVQKHEVGGVGAFDNRSDDEIIAEFQKEAAELGIPLDEGTKH